MPLAPQPAPPQPEAPAAARPARSAELAENVAEGRARFRERFEAHRRQQAADEAAARNLVARWDRLMTGFNAALPQLDADPAYGPTREALLGFGQEVRGQPGAVEVLRQQGEAFGLGERPNLARVLADARPERVVGRIVGTAEVGMRAHLQQQAVQEAAQEAARRQALAQPRPSQRSGPRMGM